MRLVLRLTKEKTQTSFDQIINDWPFQMGEWKNKQQFDELIK